MESIQHTPNRMAFNASTDENKNTFITAFKTSPKSPGPVSKIIEKKKLFKKKGVKKALRQRNRLDSQSSELSDASQLTSQKPVSVAYNLIEFYGDHTLGESAQENIISCNPAVASTSASGISSESYNLNDLQAFSTHNGELSTAGISVHQTPKKVIFVIPEGWASSIEIMRLPLPASFSSSPESTNDQHANSVGPVRSKAKTYGINRSTPYYSSRRDRQRYYARANDSELTLTAGRNNTKNHNIPEYAEIDAYNNFTVNSGFKYEPQDYQQTSNSIGPIRRNNKRRAFYTPYRNAARERTNYNSTDSASTSTSDSYNQADSGAYYSNRKNYKDSDKPNKSILCWHCCRRGHKRINCPSWRMNRSKY